MMTRRRVKYMQLVTIKKGRKDAHLGCGNTLRRRIWSLRRMGKKYEQVWGHCNFARCKAKYRAKCNHGTTEFSNHLKAAHKIVKGSYNSV
jgi:hypothetical protein